MEIDFELPDPFCGEVEIDLPINVYQIGGQYYLDMRGFEIDYEDEDVDHS